MTGNEADQLYAAKMAAQKIALASLGFDERNITITGREEGRFSSAGFMRGKNTWVAMAGGASTPVHESIHRGIAVLKERGVKEAKELSGMKEELVTRAILLRKFGDVEETEEGGGKHPQIDEARKLAKNPDFIRIMNELERQASYAIAEENIKKYPDIVLDIPNAVKAGKGE